MTLTVLEPKLSKAARWHGLLWVVTLQSVGTDCDEHVPFTKFEGLASKVA